MGLSFVAVFLYAGSMSTSEIVGARGQLVFCLFPFVRHLHHLDGRRDQPRAVRPRRGRGRTRGGFHTEYSSLKFALFFLAEYVNMVTVSALATSCSSAAGAHRSARADLEGANGGYWPVLWFLGKALASSSCSSGCAAPCPRMRYDQFMKFGWKVLIPVSLAWIVAVAIIRELGGGPARPAGCSSGPRSSRWWYSCVTFLIPEKKPEPDRRAGGRRVRRFADGYPVPPIAPVGRHPEGGSRMQHRSRDAVGSDRRIRRHVPHDVQEGRHRAVPVREGAHRAALPRPPPAQPLAGRPGEVLGCELCAWACPADAIYVEGASQHRGRSDSAPGSATAASTRSTTCAASSADSASRPARRVRSR